MLTLEERKGNFIRKSKEVHGNNYDYSKVNYVNSKTKVTIICSVHGEFQQIPNDHIKGYKCRRCSYTSQKENKKITTEIITDRFKGVWGEQYDYSDFNYEKSSVKSNVICREHGVFYVSPYAHLSGLGCSLCGDDKRHNNLVECHQCKKEFMQGRRRKFCSADCYNIHAHSNPNKNISNKNRQIRYKYGLTESDMSGMLSNCSNSCEICNKYFSMEDINTKPNIDHCHTTDSIRGLLCRPCNLAIGILKEDINILQNAITYLNKHKDVF